MRTADESNKWFCDSLLKYVNPECKTILDVGCGNGDLVKYIAMEHSPELIIGIEPALTEHWDANEDEGENWRIKYGNAHELAFPDNTFDVVVSFSTFEHIDKTDMALSEIKRVLKPYGRFYTEFMPIWTSAAGHHFIHGKDRWWMPEHLMVIPPWGHLYLEEIEMRKHLEDSEASRELIDEIIHFIYHSNIINRYSRTKLTQAFIDSQMIIRHYEERVSFNRLGFITGEKNSELTRNVKKNIEKTRYDISDLGVVGMRVCLEKYNEL